MRRQVGNGFSIRGFAHRSPEMPAKHDVCSRVDMDVFHVMSEPRVAGFDRHHYLTEATDEISGR